MKFGGYVKADFIYDFDPIDCTDSFVTTSIPVGAAPRTNARFHRDRLALASTPVGQQTIVRLGCSSKAISSAKTMVTGSAMRTVKWGHSLSDRHGRHLRTLPRLPQHLITKDLSLASHGGLLRPALLAPFSMTM